MSELSYRQILVGKHTSGMRGLDEIFAELYAAPREPQEELIAELVARAKRHNYIPPRAESDFGAALLREYREFYEEQKTGTRKPQPQQETWRGIPREQIPWYPLIDNCDCDGCGECIVFCPHNVFGWHEDKATVKNPFNCIVGCSMCVDHCPLHLISFPPRSMLDDLAKHRR